SSPTATACAPWASRCASGTCSRAVLGTSSRSSRSAAFVACRRPLVEGDVKNYPGEGLVKLSTVDSLLKRPAMYAFTREAFVSQLCRALEDEGVEHRKTLELFREVFKGNGSAVDDAALREEVTTAWVNTFADRVHTMRLTI